ncbi:DUF523 domain-containing protein, partial [Acerihabitans sp.]|uniref:DUF523 domain-containing protein n=1 Tax=Acerihabitans sp. TaxID=2811394 RepID=UPI002EDB039D
MGNKIPVGISACLMGEKVRFDGGHRRFAFAMDELAPYVHFVPICPEMAIGLPTPRPALRLVRDEQGRVAMRTGKGQDDTDLTQAMQSFSERQVQSLGHLCGYIVCAKSPSCGMERVRVYDRAGARKNGVGLYTRELMRQLPWLPVEEDGRLHD